MNKPQYLIGVELEAHGNLEHMKCGRSRGYTYDMHDILLGVDKPGMTTAEVSAMGKAIVLSVDGGKEISNGFTSDGGGMEWQSKPMKLEGWLGKKPLITEIFTKLKSSGFQCEASPWAGIHIHIDKTAFDNAQHFANMLRLCIYNFNFLEFLTGRYARIKQYVEDNYLKCVYAKEWGNDTLEAVNKEFRSNNSYRFKPHGDTGTIEFRFFNSTLNVDKFYAMIEFMVSAIECSRTLKSDTGSSRYGDWLYENFHDLPDLGEFAYNYGATDRPQKKVEVLVEPATSV